MTRIAVTIEDLLRFKFVGDPQMKPDGSHAAFTVKAIDAERNCYLSHIWVANLINGEARQFTYGDGRDSSPRWSPDGRSIIFLRARDQRSQVWTIPSNGGESRQLTHMPEGSFGAIAWSPDGKRVAFTFRPTHQDWTEEELNNRRESGKSNPPRVITRLSYRLDGVGFLDCRRHIWICDAENGESMQLTSGDYDHEGPVWSPDGKWIAFIANRSDDPVPKPYEVDIWLVPSSGGDLRKVTTSVGFKANLSWSPDGERIAYTGHEAGDDPWMPRHHRLWVTDVERGGSKCLTLSLDRTVGNATIGDIREYGEGGQRPIWSRDGQRLFFIVSDSGSCHLYTVALEGEHPRQLTRGELDISSFTADAERGRFALLLGTHSMPAEIYSADVPAGELSHVAHRPVTDMNTRTLDELSIQEPEEIRFQSADGTPLHGWLLKPPDFDETRMYPLIMQIHGGPHSQYGNIFFHEMQVLAARGYVVLYTNPRGSLGYSEEFAASIKGNWGSVDFEDLMAAAEFAEGLSYVDAARMAVMGGSYGGYMVNWIIGHDSRFKCAVTDRTVSNMHADFGTVDSPEYADGFGYWEGDAWDNPEVLWQQSPLRYAANIHTPLLIIHSEGDLRCPIHHAEQLFTALKHLKREVVFVRYPLETNHGMALSGPPDLRLDRLHRILEWLDRYLMPARG